MRADEPGGLAAVEVAIADVERRARIELEAKPGRQRPGETVSGRADRPAPVLLTERDGGLGRDRLALRIDPNLRKPLAGVRYGA